LNLAERRVEALFRHDMRGRLVEISQWEGGVAPRFFLMRTGAGAFARFRHDVPDDLAARLSALCAREPLSDPPSARPRANAAILSSSRRRASPAAWA
jgi:hypothetical protein